MTEPRSFIAHILLRNFQRGGNWAMGAFKKHSIGVSVLSLTLVAALTAILFSELAASSARAGESAFAPSSAGAGVAQAAALPGQVEERFPFEASLSGPVLQSFSTASNVTVFMLEATGVENRIGEFTFVVMLVQDGSILPQECTTGVGSTGGAGIGHFDVPRWVAACAGVQLPSMYRWCRCR